jgi:hypothetical protein
MNEIEFNSTKSLSRPETPATEILWFSIHSKKEVQREIERLKQERRRSVRLGIACAEFNSKKGVKWYDWLLPTLGDNFDLELCFDNFLKNPERRSPQKHTLSGIVEHFILKHGKYFASLELWRNPLNRAKPDISENIFAEDVVFAATWAKYWGKKVILGGIQTLDFDWISKLSSSPFLRNVEFVEIDRAGGYLNRDFQFYGQARSNSNLSDNRKLS